MHFSKLDRSSATVPPNPEYFEGLVRMQHVLTAAQTRELEVIAVFFENGARTIPHTHPTDQALWVVEGACIVADDTGRWEVAAGQCVLLPANQWHWHGAAPGGSACHVSIRKPGPSDWKVPRKDW